MSNSSALRINPNLFELAAGEACDLAQCRAACCVGGIWVDLLAAQQILAHKETIAPLMAAEYRDQVERWFGEDELEHPDFPSGIALSTNVGPRSGDADRLGCIFVRADHRCSLQMASDQLGLPSPGLKPFDCATYPILRSEGELLYDDQSAKDHPGADCQMSKTAQLRPRHQVFRLEIELCIGKSAYAALAGEHG